MFKWITNESLKRKRHDPIQPNPNLSLFFKSAEEVKFKLF
jgi:hypothetical protein